MQSLHLPDLFSASFWQSVALSGSEISLTQAERSPQALGPWLGVIFWLILLLVPLTGVTRTQPVTGASYVLFLVASATVFGVMFCIPWIGRGMSMPVIALLAGATLLGTWRWRRGTVTSPVTSATSQDQGPTP